MEEAERICDRIAILDAGRIVAEGTRADLLRRLGRGYARATFVKADDAIDAGPLTLEETSLEAFRRMPNALRVVREGAGLRIDVLDSSALVAELARTALEGGLRVLSLTLAPPSLEALFLELTGHQFRDE